MAAIVLDPGHGGESTVGGSAPFGAVGPHWGLREKALTLRLARLLAAELQAHGARAVLTRATDTEVGLDTRAMVANREGAGVFLSLHFNATPEEYSPAKRDGVNRTECYVHDTAGPEALALAERVGKAAAAAVGLPFKGAAHKALRVINPGLHAPGTLAVLLEVSFVSCAGEEERLATEPGRLDAVARALAPVLLAR